jgi:outer membrane protein TolC
MSNSITLLSARAVLSTALVVSAAGCAATTKQVDAQGAIERSLSIEIRAEGSPPADDVVFTAADAVRCAVETSAELQAALARVRVAQADADLAALLPNPILSLVFRFPEGGGSPDIEAGLGADLLALLQRPDRAAIAGHRLEAEAARSLSTALDVVADVQRKYIEVQSLEAFVEATDRRSALIDRLRAMAEARLELGEGTRHELTTLDAERSELGVEIAERRQGLAVARLALARAIGEPSRATDWELEPWSAPPAVSVEERTWIDAALAARPEVLAIEWEIRAREAEEGVARAQSFDGSSVGVNAERQGEWSVGPTLAVPLPLFDSGGVRVERARALTAEERHRLTHAQRLVTEEVRAALVTRLGAQDNLERVAGELIPMQEKRRGEVEAAYQLGSVDLRSLLLAERALLEAIVRRVSLAREASLAHNRLERAVGGPARIQSPVAEARP